MDRNRYAQENKEIYRQKAAEKNGRQETTASERQPTLTIHRTILKAPVPKEAYDQWTEAVNDYGTIGNEALSSEAKGRSYGVELII